MLLLLFKQLLLLIPFVVVVLSSLTVPLTLTYASVSTSIDDNDTTDDTKQYYEYTTQLIPIYVPPSSSRTTTSSGSTKTRKDITNTKDNTNTEIRTLYDNDINLNVYIVTTTDLFSVLIPTKKIQYTKKQNKLRTSTSDLYKMYMKEYESDQLQERQNQQQQNEQLNVTTTTTTTTTTPTTTTEATTEATNARIFKVPYIKRDEQIQYNRHNHHYRQQKQKQKQSLQSKWILQKTLYQGTKNNCLVASNGGPYNPNNSPVGSVISDSTIISNKFITTGTTGTTNIPTNYIGFGLTKPIILDPVTGNIVPINSSNTTDTTIHQQVQQQYWIVGNIYNTTTKQYNYNINPNIHIEQYVTGFDWLIYNNTNVVSTSDDTIGGTTGASLAPRTAVGITSTGKLVIITVDGYGEKWFRYQGITLYNFAQLLVNNYTTTSTNNNDTIVYAINMDGGGSTTLVSKILQSQQQQQEQDQEQSSSNNNMLHYVNRPTCIDIPIQCERRISTVLCIKERFS